MLRQYSKPAFDSLCSILKREGKRRGGKEGSLLLLLAVASMHGAFTFLSLVKMDSILPVCFVSERNKLEERCIWRKMDNGRWTMEHLCVQSSWFLGSARNGSADADRAGVAAKTSCSPVCTCDAVRQGPSFPLFRKLTQRGRGGATVRRGAFPLLLSIQAFSLICHHAWCVATIMYVALRLQRCFPHKRQVVINLFSLFFLAASCCCLWIEPPFWFWSIFFFLAAEWLRFCHGNKLILIITDRFSLHGKCLTWLIFIIHIRWWCVDQQRLAAAAAGWFDILVGRDVFQGKTCATS